MRRQAMMLILVVASAGCAVDNAPHEGDITFDWSFAGQDCGPAGVATVGVQVFDVNGNSVTTDSVACSAESVTYTDFTTGDYSFTLTGISPGGTVLYEADQPITVNSGSNEYPVNLSLAQ